MAAVIRTDASTSKLPAMDRNRHKKPSARSAKGRSQRREAFEDELNRLQADIAELSTDSLKAKFAELPLSSATAQGLQSSYFTTLTPIQARSLPHSLKGQDVLAAARTGSGKTLAFLIPLLEKLHRAKWGPNDGLGALVISPTRELAVQIFDVLRKIGHQHSFSAGLVIGGKNLKDEQERLSRMNILISTPGRLLQHMDQTIAFDTSNLQLLVLDEADRILDMGFSKTLDAIIANLPAPGPNGRQTLLFSATQSNSITALARLSLKDPTYISVRDHSALSTFRDGQDAKGLEGLKESETPDNLEQHYMVIDLDRKLDVLWGFIKSHLSSKMLVFMSSCKQVRFAYETFRHLRPGISLLHIHGKQKQPKRLDIFQRFTTASHAVLFATDIAARGLDFPSVNWVIQADCPEDVDTYIHRAGRTARYNSKGKALLFLLPSEQEGFLQRLMEKKLDSRVSQIKINPSKASVSIQKQFQSLAFRFPEIKFLAQRAFISYVRSVHLQKDKKTFKLDELPLDRYAASLGLAGAPKIKFVGKQQAAAKKNKARDLAKLKAEIGKTAFISDDDTGAFSGEDASDTEESSTADVEEQPSTDLTDGAPAAADDLPSTSKSSKTTKYDKMYKRKNQNVLSEHYNKVVEHEEEEQHTQGSILSADNDQEDFIVPASKPTASYDMKMGTDNDIEEAFNAELEHNDLSKRKLKAGVTKKGLQKLRGRGEKLVFDEEGAPHALYEFLGEEAIEDVDAERRRFIADEGGRMQSRDAADKEAERDAKRDKKRKRKEREREVDAARKGLAQSAVLGPEGEQDSGPEDTQGAAMHHLAGEADNNNNDDDDADLEVLALRALKKKARR